MPAPNDHTTSAASNVGSSTPRSNKTPESLAATTELDEMLTASQLLRALTRTLSEEMAALRQLVDDEDADCLSRDLRAERLAAYEHVLRLFRQAERWEW